MVSTWRLSLGVLSALPCAVAHSQPPSARVVFNIAGVVRDSASGEVLPNARVGVLSSARVVHSNADGRFTLLGVGSGSQQLRVQYVGYATRTIPFDADTVRAPIAVSLSKAIVRLSTTEVRAPTDVSPTVVSIGRDVSVQSISTAQVEAMPSVGEADVFRTLQMLPSVAGAGNGTASLSVRGGKPDQNLVLLDGMTVYHVDHFFGLFSAFNTDALKDIQLYAGGFPAKFGGRVSSVVNLTGKAGDENNFRASGGINLLSARGVVEIPLGRGSILLSGRRSYTDVIRSGLYGKLFSFAGQGSTANTSTQQGGRAGGPGGRFQQQQVEPSFYFYDLNGKLTYRLSNKDVTTLSVYRGLDNLDQSQALGGGFQPFNPNGGAGTTATATLNDLTVWGNQGASARWFRQWNDRFTTDILGAVSRYTSDGDRTASGGLPNGGARFNFGFTENNTVEDATVRIENALDLASWSRIEFGAWNTQNRVDYTFAVATADSTQRNRNTVRNNDATTTAFYLQHTWTPVASVDITTGVRSNRYSATGATYTEPRVNAGLQLTPSLRLKGAWGRYHQFVNRVENEDVLQGSRDFWLLADTALRPQASTHTIVGLLYDRPSWALNIEAYDKTLENATIFSRRFRQAFGVNTGSLFFTGEGRAKGLEFLLERKIGSLTGWLSYTLARSTNVFADFDQGREFAGALDQRHELKGFGSWSIGKWDVSGTAIYGSGRPYTAPVSQYEIKLLDGTLQRYVNVSDKNSQRLPSYQRADLALARSFESGGAFDWRIGLSAYNILNRRNVSFRKFDLSTQPMTVTDVAQLGLTPSLDVKLTRRGLRNTNGRGSR